MINLHRLHTSNIGDKMCGPAQYFKDQGSFENLEILGFREADAPDQKYIEDWHEKVAQSKKIIVGGGGLLNIDFFEPALKTIAGLKTNGQKSVIWGAGHNSWMVNDWRAIKEKIDISAYNFDLIGIRDHNQPYEWVPCVSCLHEIFNGAPKGPTIEVGVYAHADALADENFRKQLPDGFPLLTNDAPFEAAIKFIASCDLLLTDSYHGMYWATLLNRRVIAFPSSSKFYDSRYPAPLCDPLDWKRYVRMAQYYPEALTECRSANMAFAEKVWNL